MTIDTRDFDALAADIARYPDAAQQAGKIAMDATMLYLHGQIPGYPSPPAPGSFAFVSDRQRRYFFAALREGRIQIPYRRTGTLGRSITTDVDVSGDEIVGEIGTGLDYAPWAVGPDYPGIDGQYQAHIHEGRWWQFDEVMADNLPDAERLFIDTFFDEFKKLV